MSELTSRTREVRGLSVPSFLYGTAWKEERTAELTELALEAGFRGIDTANQRRHYFEAGVGEAVGKRLAGGGLERQDLFLQTKFTYARGQDHRLPYDPKTNFATQVVQSFTSSLEHLGTSYLDSYLLHGPSTGSGIAPADWEVWRALEALADAGKTRFIGVSNVSLGQLRELFRGARVKPAFVQNRCYASTGWDREVRAFCSANDVVYQGFSLLTANHRELRQPSIAGIGERTGLTLAQLVFRFALEVGIMPLTGTTDPEHMAEDLAAFDAELRAEDVRTIELAGPR